MYLLDGGNHFDGRVITELNEKQILDTINDLKEKKINNVVISGVFSPSSPQHEQQVHNQDRFRYHVYVLIQLLNITSEHGTFAVHSIVLVCQSKIKR